MQGINILRVGSITWLTKPLKVYCSALPSCCEPLQPTRVVAPSCGGCVPHRLFCGCPWFCLLHFAQADAAPPKSTYCLPVSWSEVPWHKLCWDCRGCQSHLGRRLLLTLSFQFEAPGPPERFELSPENSIIFLGHPSWAREGAGPCSGWCCPQEDVSWPRLARAQHLCD